MTIREKFRRRVVELIHGLPYDEAIKKELQADLSYPEDWKIENEPNYNGLPITIGRVMKALPANIGIDSSGIILINGIESEDNWILTNENGQECTDDDQSDETIEKLYNFFK